MHCPPGEGESPCVRGSRFCSWVGEEGAGAGAGGAGGGVVPMSVYRWPLGVGAALLGGVGGCLLWGRGGSPVLSLLPGPGGAALRRRSAAVSERGRGCLRWRKCVGALGVTGWTRRAGEGVGEAGAGQGKPRRGWRGPCDGAAGLALGCPQWRAAGNVLPRSTLGVVVLRPSQREAAL